MKWTRRQLEFDRLWQVVIPWVVPALVALWTVLMMIEWGAEMTVMDVLSLVIGLVWGVLSTWGFAAILLRGARVATRQRQELLDLDLHPGQIIITERPVIKDGQIIITERPVIKDGKP